MTETATYQDEYMKLLRMHQQQQIILESEAEKSRARVALMYIQEVEALDERVSFIKKALVMRRQFLELQRFKQQSKTEKANLKRKHMQEILDLKARWESVT